LQKSVTFAVRGMNLDWGAVAQSGGANSGDDATNDSISSSYFAKKHTLAKGLALDINVALPMNDEAALSAGLPLQDILVKAPVVSSPLSIAVCFTLQLVLTSTHAQIDVGFTSRQAVHVFGILEELLDGLFRKRGVLEHIDVLQNDGLKPPRLELHRKRRVLVAIDKLVLRLLPSTVQAFPIVACVRALSLL
jgi:hypothetical protein